MGTGRPQKRHFWTHPPTHGNKHPRHTPRHKRSGGVPCLGPLAGPITPNFCVWVGYRALTPPPLYTTATPPVCPSKRAHTTRRFCPQRTRFSFAVGSSTMRPVPNRRLGPIWALLEHENPISESFPVVHSVGGADTARLHDANEHQHRRKVHISIAQHQGPLTLVLFVAAGARVAHQARAVVATRSRDKNAQEQPTPATASWGAEEARTMVKTTAFHIPRSQPNALQPPACPRFFWGVRQRQI